MTADRVLTDNAMKVTTDAVQVLGGYGYTRDFPVERYRRGRGDADLRANESDPARGHQPGHRQRDPRAYHERVIAAGCRAGPRCPAETPESR